MAQTIYFAASADGYVGTTLIDGIEPVSWEGTQANVLTRTSSWNHRVGEYGFEATIDANNESAMCRISKSQNSAPIWTGDNVAGDAWVNACYEASDWTLLAAKYTIGYIAGNSGWFNTYTLRVETNGDLRFYDAAGTATGSAYSPGFVADTLYWFLFHFDSSTNDQIDVYIGEADPNDSRRLKNVRDWDTAVMTLTDTAQTGTFGQLYWGPKNAKNTNANITGRWEPPVHMSERPTQPIVTEYLEVNADGYYSATGAGGTAWDNEDASTASYDRVDDPNSAADDGDTTYVEIPALAGNAKRVTFGVESPSSIKATDNVYLVIACARYKRVGAGATGNSGLVIRQNSTDSTAPSTIEFPDYAAAYHPAVKKFSTAPDGTSWTYDKLLDLEVGAFTDDTQRQHRISAMGAIVVYQPVKSLPYQRRSSMRAALVR